MSTSTRKKSLYKRKNNNAIKKKTRAKRINTKGRGTSKKTIFNKMMIDKIKNYSQSMQLAMRQGQGQAQGQM
jgi:hypothetical protein